MGINIEKVEQQILEGKKIENILEEIDWKEFEETVVEILKKHDFKTIQNFRFKTDRRFEVDIIAFNPTKVLFIDCKQWGRKRYKQTALKYAVEDQKHRLKEFKKFLKGNIIIQAKLKITDKKAFIPLIITLWEETLIEHDEVFIIPIWKLNEFLIHPSVDTFK